MSKTMRELKEEWSDTEKEEMRKAHRNQFGLDGAFDPDEYIFEVQKNVKSSVHNERARGDGGFTNYYSVPEGATQLSDLIYYKGMNHSIGEAFCALYRMNDNGEKIRNIKKVMRYMQLELDREEGN